MTTAELRVTVLALLSHLENTDQAQFEIEDDYYWFVPKEEVYNPYQPPALLTLGQLSHDWAEVQRLAQGEADASSYALVWLSAILRRVGEGAVR